MDTNQIIHALLEPISSSSSSDSSTDSSTESSEISSVSNGSIFFEDDAEEALLFPLYRYLTTGDKRQRVDNYLAIVESWSDLEFKQHLRLPRALAYRLIDDLEASAYTPKNSFGKPPITGKLSFLIFLWFISNTEPLRTMSDRFDISISSVFRILRRVLDWMLSKMDEVIKWPSSNNEITRVCDGFYSKKQLPHVLGAIDCTHIHIEKPAVNHNKYYNRKKYPSIILQAVVDSRLRFINVHCGEPGSLHDARVLRRSPLHDAATEDKEGLFPNNTFLLGDSAYPSLSWLVPPFRDNGRLMRQQRQFNFRHSSTRMAVEKAFGVLKGRFRRIKFFTEYRELIFITKTVIAACILHNYCIDEDDDLEIENDDGLDMANNPVPQQNMGNQNREDRRMLFFREVFPEI